MTPGTLRGAACGGRAHTLSLGSGKCGKCETKREQETTMRDSCIYCELNSDGEHEIDCPHNPDNNEAVAALRAELAQARAERDAAVKQAQDEHDWFRLAKATAIRHKLRGDTYRARAQALYRKLRRDTAIEKEWDATYEAMCDRVHERIVQAGVQIKKIDEHGRRYYESFFGRLDDLGRRWKELEAARAAAFSAGFSACQDAAVVVVGREYNAGPRAVIANIRALAAQAETKP